MVNFGILKHTRYRQYKQTLSEVKTPNGTKMSTEKSTTEEDKIYGMEHNREKFQYILVTLRVFLGPITTVKVESERSISLSLSLSLSLSHTHTVTNTCWNTKRISDLRTYTV
jgi:hypothetical protein